MNLPLSHSLDQHQVRQSFNRVADTYEQADWLSKSVGETLLERLECLPIQPQQILEVGAGTGRLTRALSLRYKKSNVYAVDLSEKSLNYAHSHAPYWFSKQHFICANATQLPFPNDSVDLLVSNLMLLWCNDIQEVFDEFARVLTPAGTLLFSTLGPDSLKELRYSWATVDNASHVHHFLDMHHMGDALLTSGFSNPVMDVDWFQHDFPDVLTLMRELKQTGAHNLSTHRRRGLTGKQKFKAMLAAYEKYRVKEDLIPATYEVIYGYASGKREIAPQETAKVVMVDRRS